MFSPAALTGDLPAKYSAMPVTTSTRITMSFKLMPTLWDTLHTLTEATGITWNRTKFFQTVIDRSLPLRATTPGEVFVVDNMGGEDFDAGFQEREARRLALLGSYAIKNLALHGAADIKNVALEPGDPDFLTWEQIKVYRERHGAQRADFMGESVFHFSEWIKVTDETCRVPPETIEELLALTPKPAAVSNREAKIGVKHRMSQNLLDGLIKAAIDRAGSLSYQDVWIHLREIAKDGTPPFTGLVEGDRLGYIDDNNKYKELSKDALRKRMGKYQRENS